jgi:hypothetical protein
VDSANKTGALHTMHLLPSLLTLLLGDHILTLVGAESSFLSRNTERDAADTGMLVLLYQFGREGD